MFAAREAPVRGSDPRHFKLGAGDIISMGLDCMERLVGVDADELLIGHQRRDRMGFQGDRLRLEFGNAQDRGVIV